MESWNVDPTDDEREYVLRSPTQTVFSFSKRIRFDVSLLLCEMELHGVPLGYTRGLRRVRLTVLRDLGTYLNNVINLNVTPYVGPPSSVCQTFVHELGHHVDELEAISDDPRVIREKRHGWKHLPDPYSRKNVVEYVGVGFETFYFGTDEQKRSMRKRNKVLYSRISQAHRKYRER